jgi:hypothetical protein
LRITELLAQIVGLCESLIEYTTHHQFAIDVGWEESKHQRAASGEFGQGKGESPVEAKPVGGSGEVLESLKAKGHQVLKGKGGFLIKGKGFVSLAEARRMTGIEAPKRELRPRVSAWGDYATIAMINGVGRGKK